MVICNLYHTKNENFSTKGGIFGRHGNGRKKLVSAISYKKNDQVKKPTSANRTLDLKAAAISMDRNC